MGRLGFQSKYYFWTEVCAPAFTFGLPRTMSLPPSIILSCSLLSSLSNPPSAVIIIFFFYQIRSHGASYKNQQSSSGRSSRGPVRSILVNLPPSGSNVSHSERPFERQRSATFRQVGVLLAEKKKKETPAAALNQRSHPETLDKHTAPAFLSGPVGLWGREVCA